MNKYAEQLFEKVEAQFWRAARQSVLDALVGIETNVCVVRFALESCVLYDLSFSRCISSALMTHGRGAPTWDELRTRMYDAFAAADESEAAKRELKHLIGVVLTKAGTEGILRTIFASYLDEPTD